MPLDLESFPLRMFSAAQERSWVASSIDTTHEREHLASLAPDERELLLRMVAGFRVGERGVTHELAPLLEVLRDQGRLDEEMFVTSPRFEEARHVEFFERWIQAAIPGVWGRDVPYPRLSGDLFSMRLPEVMRALRSDHSPEAQVRAVVTYHLWVEGVGAEAGYPLFFEIFERTGRFPALEQGITLIRRDEARHIAFGNYLLQRLIAEHPSAEAAFEAELAAIEPLVESGADQTFAPFERGAAPFGLDRERYRALYRENFELQRRNVRSRVLV